MATTDALLYALLLAVVGGFALLGGGSRWASVGALLMVFGLLFGTLQAFDLGLTARNGTDASVDEETD